VNMALGFAANKKLNFDVTEDEDEAGSPCHTRSGIVYKPRNVRISETSSDSESDIADSVFESSEEEQLTLQPLTLEHFGNGLSPIRREQSRVSSVVSSPVSFLRRRQRTSTKVVTETPNGRKNATVSRTGNSNTNPYVSPALRKCSKRLHSSSSFSSSGTSGCDSDDSGRYSPLPGKKMRVSELSVSRYEEEFLELSEIADGGFGTVRLARHRLDGSDYAVKVNKHKLRRGSYEEKKALNEVFAHAALNNHENVVRYFNSWVEDGLVYIQNEFCQGGTLSDRIQEKRASGKTFSEETLMKILNDVASGLQYIHGKQMVHMDIKPENIFITHEQVTDDRSDECYMMNRMDLKDSDDISSTVYKIGDLGHASSIISGSLAPEEGDCRYMAPELFLMNLNQSQLTQADIFSLGLSIYEAASLRVLPRNSLDGQEYESLRNGSLPYLNNYSSEFNNLLRSMVEKDAMMRPSATEVVSHCQKQSGGRELEIELMKTKEKLKKLRAILGQ